MAYDDDNPTSEPQQRIAGDVTVGRLYQAIERSRDLMTPFIENRIDLIRQYTGAHYGDNGAKNIVPVPFIEMATNIYVRQLAAQNPQVLVTTPHPPRKHIASTLELAVNDELVTMNFEEELQAAVYDAMFGVGCMKIGIEDDDAAGRPYASAIDFGDLILDLSVTKFKDMAYAGNYYRVPLEEARQNERFDRKIRRELTSEDFTLHREDGTERTQSIGADETASDDEYTDYVELIDLYLYRERKFVTLTVDPRPRALRISDWTGPAHGPYRFLHFTRVPGNLMPLAPMQVLIDLHELANRLYIKTGNQADRQKTILTYRSAAQQDAQNIRDASDGEIVASDDPASLREVRFGGADPGTQGAYLQTKQDINWFGGNLDVLGGLSPQADTATQEQLLHVNSGARVAWMQQQTVTFTRRVVEDLVWWMWTDPIRTYETTKNVPGTEISVIALLTPQQRLAPLNQYDIKVEPYSLRPRTPEQRGRLLVQLFTEIILPMMPLMQQQGATIDIRGFLKQIGRLYHLDELEDVVIFAMQQAQAEQGQQPGSSKPSQTTRRYERVNRPGATRQGNEGIMQRMLAGANNVQPSESAAVGRNVG